MDKLTHKFPTDSEDLLKFQLTTACDRTTTKWSTKDRETYLFPDILFLQLCYYTSLILMKNIRFEGISISEISNWSKASIVGIDGSTKYMWQIVSWELPYLSVIAHCQSGYLHLTDSLKFRL